MDRLPLNKMTLLAERRRLQNFRTFLPALEVKRRGLLLAHASERKQLAERSADVTRLIETATRLIPMLADDSIEVESLLSIERCDTFMTSISGVEAPQLRSVTFSPARIGRFTRPHWVEEAVALARQAVEAELSRRIAEQRVARLAAALARAVQRVNLLERVLIPRTMERIRRIELQLGDLQRAEVIAAKLSKTRRGRVS